MRGTIAALALVACLGFVAGCGSDDSSSDDQTATAGAMETTQDNTTSGAAPSETGGGGEAQGAESPGSESGSGGNGGQRVLSEEELSREFKAPAGGDDSIQTFGEEAEGDEKDEVVAAMQSFFRALAANDAERVCAGLSSGNVKQFELFLKAQKEEGDCTTVLAKFLGRQKAEAEKAINGQVFQVRVEGENAFVLFIPEGGTASYFVMKREDDEWKSTSISTGTPFNPTSPPPASK
jgi:hypothetical protein